MPTRKQIYTRTHRHRDKRKLVNRRAVRAHRKFGGRTGGIWSKRTHSTKHFSITVIIQNAPTWWFNQTGK